MHNEKLEKVYRDLYQHAFSKIVNEEYSIDINIENELDNRFGMTLLLRPSDAVKTNIQSFIDELKSIEPAQYFYPNSDMHITLLSIISCYEGFNLDTIDVEEYSKVIRKSLEAIEEFEIDFKGVTASESAIMIKGYPKNETLQAIRENLRAYFAKSNLQKSLDKRYLLITAHVMVVRFKKKLDDTMYFMNCIEKYREHDFGVSRIDTIHLVYNDWYQRKEKVRELMEFKI